MRGKIVRFYLLLAVLLTLSVGLHAAEDTSLQGNVKDPQGAVVVQATVKLFPDNSSTPLTTTTGESGDYSFVHLSPGQYVLEVEKEHLHGTPLTVHLERGAAKTQDVTLQLVGVSETVVVTAAPEAQTLDQVSKPLTVISNEELSQLNDVALTDIVAKTPNVWAMNCGGPGHFTPMFFRGLPDGGTSILVDGMRFRDPADEVGSLNDSLENIYPVDVDHIEVMRGSGSSLYGTNAVGGVVNIVTNRGGGATRGEVKVEGGGLGTFRGRGSVSGGAMHDRLGYSLGAQQLDVTEGVDGHSPTRSSGGLGTVSYKISPKMNLTGRLWGNYGTVAGYLDPTSTGIPAANIPTTGTVPAIPLSPEQVANLVAGRTVDYGNATYIPSMWNPDADSSNYAHFINGSVVLSDTLTPTVIWQANYQRVTSNRESRSVPQGAGVFPGAIASYYKDAGNIDTAGAHITGRVESWLSVTGGYEFERESFIGGGTNTPVGGTADSEFSYAEQSSNAEYFATELSLLQQRLRISLSGRAQEFQVDVPKFVYAGTGNPYQNASSAAPPAGLVGDISLLYLLSPNTKLRAHGGNSYRAPSLFERFGVGIYSDVMYAYGNPALSAERYNSIDGGIDQYLFKNRLSLSATVFYTRVVQQMVFTENLPQPDPYGRTMGYIEGGSGISRGVELSFEANPMRRMSVRGSYSYANAGTDQDSTIPGYFRVFNVPKHAVTGYWNMQWTRNFITTMDVQYHSNMLNSWIYYGYPPLAYELPGFTVTNLNASYQLWQRDKTALRAYSKIGNIFNRRYYPDGYRAPQIYPLFGLEYVF